MRPVVLAFMATLVFCVCFADPAAAMCYYDRERAWLDVARLPQDKCYHPTALSAAVALWPAGTSYIVVADGAVIAERNAGAVLLAASYSKTLIGLAAALADAEGLIDLVDLDDLLNHRAGWANTLGNPPCSGGGTSGKWAYSTCGFSMAAQAIQQAVGMSLQNYLNTKLSALGVSIQFDGDYGAGADAEMSVRDAAKIMLMLARNGQWNGVQVLPPHAVANLVAGPCNPGVPFQSPTSYITPIGVEPPAVYCRGLWFGNNDHLVGVAFGGFGGQGGVEGTGFVAWVLDRDTVVVAGGPDARPAPGGQNSIDGQPYAEIISARTGTGRQITYLPEPEGLVLFVPAILILVRRRTARSATPQPSQSTGSCTVAAISARHSSALPHASDRSLPRSVVK